MRLGVFGLGYVGSVAAACLAADGHRVIGVDSNTAKVELVNAGRSPVVESGLEDLIRSGIASGHLSATLSVEAAVLAADLSLICVGTPSSANGSAKRVCGNLTNEAQRASAAPPPNVWPSR